ncbi:MAG: S-layer homology domain-containing protein [Chloroflexota bacterium]
MNKNNIWRAFTLLLTLAILLSQFATAAAAPTAAPAAPVSFTILHHNDFHGQLEPSGSNPGIARLAQYVYDIRTAVGDGNMLLLDAGDEMQGSLLSNIQKGAPVIDIYNEMSYDAATFGNHEFDWGQTVLTDRTTEALYPYVTANITKKDGESCDGWNTPDFALAPYILFNVGTPTNVKVAVIGVTTQETPTITVASATEGLCFKDPSDSILHYYDEIKAAGADVIVVLSHLGYNDGGYGYGLEVYGDQTLAAKLNTAGKPVDLIIGGHSHTDLATATTVGATKVVQAHYNGRKLGRADFVVGTDGSVTINWTRITVGTADPQEPTIDAMVDAYVADPDYQNLINDPIGYVQTDLLRNYNGNSMMADFIGDSIYMQLNGDAEPTNDIDMFFNNAGGIRTDWCEKEDLPDHPGEYIWSTSAADCNTGVWAHDPMVLTYGQMFQILPFGNATVVGDMTGAQILELLHQSATLFKGAIQPAGIRYKFFRYADALPGPQPYGWGAYDVQVYDKATSTWVDLDLTKTYKVGTNEFLAPAGQDGYIPFKYMTNITYWGDMLDSVNAYVEANYTLANPYKGPAGDGLLDGRIIRNGDGDDNFEGGNEIVPLTILHHNDSHGNLDKGTYVGYTQLATLIKQERLHNPDRTLLLSSGDNIQGDAMMYYFKTAPTGFTSNGTPIADPALHINPLIKAFNAMDYDAMVLGNHEFNFGSDVFTSVLGQATFPLLQANVSDTGEYGLAEVGVLPYTVRTVGGDIQVAILGIGNHRIPNYELPSNIPGLTFSDPIATAQMYAPALANTNDVVVALTHIGFTENPNSVEVDDKVDTNLAAVTTDIDAVIGGHSHTDPSKQTVYSGNYKYLPTIIADAEGNPVVVTQAYRYNNTLGEVVIGLRAPAITALNNYEVVSQTGRYISVGSGTAEDPAIDAIVDPYSVLLAAYKATPIGATTAPIDTMNAYTEETNGANLQADASVHELESHGIDVDFHLSGAMTNKLIATTATPATPYNLTIDDMFAAMPYENSLVVISMNGPQLKAVLERAYRNYYYYKYVPDWGGYSHYTTCMLDTNAGNQIVYQDTAPELPNGNNVVALIIGGQPVDFTDAGTFYNVSTVNYLAAGSCNFNDAGATLWPLDQIVADTQYYVRDAVINYTTDMGTVSPAIEGRLQFWPSVYTDVPTTHWAWSFIGKLAAAGVTGGCGADTFCPDGNVTRAQMAVFLLRAKYGDAYVPPAAVGGVFNDVAPGDFAADYIEALADEGITDGCGGGNFCPDGNVTRAQMAVFILRTLKGNAYVPPAATGIYNDVAIGDFAADWIEALADENITAGCGGGNFCPNVFVTRAEMAVFLVTAFNLP